MENNDLKKLQAILFLKGMDGSTVKDMARILDVDTSLVRQNLKLLEKELIGTKSPFILKKFERTYWLSITPEISVDLAKNMRKDIKVRLTKSLIETLTIIAYKQPAIKSDIEKIRGSAADYALVKLMEYDLIQEAGRDSSRKGNPRTFVTTPFFLMLFDINSLKELPELEKDFVSEKTQEIELLNYDEYDASKDDEDYEDEDEKVEETSSNNEKVEEPQEEIEDEELDEITEDDSEIEEKKEEE